MNESVASPDIHIMLGEMRGQLRELVHATNNNSGKTDALTREVIEIKGVAAAIAALNVRVTAVESDVSILKTERNRREGALSLGEWLIKMVPWLIGGAGFAVAVRLLEIAG